MAQSVRESGRHSVRQLTNILRRCLETGARVEIDGLGIFAPGKDGKFHFTPFTQPKVFLAYVEEDLKVAEKLSQDLKVHGCDPWLDREKLLPGQNWPRSIERAIEMADYFVALFSRRAASKRGQFQCELRYALDCASRHPLEHNFIVPVRLEQCNVPARITTSIQYVDLFPDWDAGVKRLLDSMQRG